MCSGLVCDKTHLIRSHISNQRVIGSYKENRTTHTCMHAFNSSSTCRFFTLWEGHDRFAPEGRKRGSCIIIWFFILTYLPMGSTMYKSSVRDDHAGGSRVSADRERERAKGAQQSAIELLILLSPMLIHLRFSLQMRSNQFSRTCK